MSIFVSHSSKDKILVDQFVEKILILGCNLTDNDIFCTSIEGLGIRTGKDFRQHIKKSLKEADYAFLMISENYRESEICLNEMGAAWAINETNVKQFLFPNLGFDSLGVIMNIQQAAKLEDSHSLDELFEELTLKYSLDKKVTRWNKHKHDFLKFLDEYKEARSVREEPEIPFDFFERFLNKDADVNRLLLVTQPTLIDCKTIFSEEYYRLFFNGYCKLFEKMENERSQELNPKNKYFYAERANTNELIKGEGDLAGGMIEAAKKGYFNFNIDFYSITFVEDKNEVLGETFNVFCYLNQRWVFIAKPWRFNLE